MTHFLIEVVNYGPAWDVAIFLAIVVIIVVGVRREAALVDEDV